MSGANGKAFDLGALDTRRFSEQGRELVLRHPATGAELPFRLMVRGYDADAYQRALDAQQQRRLERLPMHKPNVDEIRADSLELSASLVAGWPPDFTIDGVAVEYTPAAAVMLLKRFPWIREQVEGAAADRGKFLPASSPS